MGMKCLDDFSNLCLSLDEKNMVSDNVIGAKYTFRFLCDDEAFQKGKFKFKLITIQYNIVIKFLKTALHE